MKIKDWGFINHDLGRAIEVDIAAIRENLPFKDGCKKLLHEINPKYYFHGWRVNDDLIEEDRVFIMYKIVFPKKQVQQTLF